MDDFKTFREVLKDEHDLFIHELNIKFDELSQQEQKSVHEKLELKKLKINARIASNKIPVEKFKQMREFELITRELWNKIQLQLRIKILYTDV